MAFAFQYQRPEKAPRWVKIYTSYVSKQLLEAKSGLLSVMKLLIYSLLIVPFLQFHFMNDCFEKIKEESVHNKKFSNTDEDDDDENGETESV